MPASTKHALNLAPSEAIRFFRQKVTMPTDRWTDLWQGMHARAFVIAGATRESILNDIRKAIEEAIANGTTIEEFRKMWDEKIENSGWAYKGDRDWRTRVIFNTNLSVAYHAGRYKQRMSPAVLKARPFNRYIPSHAAEQREEHRAFYNVVLPASHEFWDTHTPPNGWGCKCGIQSLTERGKDKLTKRYQYSSAPVQTKPPKIEHYDWQDKYIPGTIKVPKGLDPGWAYNPGKAAYGAPMAAEAMEQWNAQGAKAWQMLSGGDWKAFGRPKNIPLDSTKTKPIKQARTVARATSALQKVLGGEERIFALRGHDDFSHHVLVNAKAIAEHAPGDLGRTAFYPFIPEVFADPFEVWHAFEQHKGTGKVSLRTRIIKAVKLKNGKGFLIVVQTRKKMPEAITFIPVSKQGFNYLQNQRVGTLSYGRTDN